MPEFTRLSMSEGPEKTPQSQLLKIQKKLKRRSVKDDKEVRKCLRT
jgi:hypothetical protein